MCIGRDNVWVLAEFGTCPTLSLDGIDDVLPRRGQRDRQLEARLDIGVFGRDELATCHSHGVEDRAEIVHTTIGFAERLVGLAMRGQREGR